MKKRTIAAMILMLATISTGCGLFGSGSSRGRSSSGQSSSLGRNEDDRDDDEEERDEEREEREEREEDTGAEGRRDETEAAGADEGRADESENAAAGEDITEEDGHGDEEVGAVDPGFFPGAFYVVRVDYERQDGEDHLEEVAMIDGKQYTDEDDVYVDGELVYSRIIFNYEMGGTQMTEREYGIYSLDYDIDLLLEPNSPENTSDLQTIEIDVDSPESMEDVDLGKNFEDVGMRGGTGIWYAGICSVRNGKLVPYAGQ